MDKLIRILQRYPNSLIYRYHLENNPIEVTREDVKRLLEIIMEN